MHRLALALAAAAAAALAVLPAAAPAPAAAQDRDRGLSRTSTGEPRASTIARGLRIPWDLAFLPDRRALVTERGGTVRLLGADRRLRRRPVGRIAVSARGEGGLLGVAVDPRFGRGSNRNVYFFYTTSRGMRVARYTLRGTRLRRARVVVRGIAAGPIHDSGRIHFGPDGRLYIATGDAGRPSLAQRPSSLNGKFLRISARAVRGRGGRPQVVSRGHRNPQGFDWHPRTRRLYATEHGPDRDDEVNRIVRGANYGWPSARGPAHGPGFRDPLAVFSPSIAPSGGTFLRLPGSAWTNDFVFAALRGAQLRRMRFGAGDRVTVNDDLYRGRFGRLRTVVEGPDGALYVLTSNRDGRGAPRSGDDRIIRIVPPGDG